MSYDKSVADHYLHGDLLKSIEAALPSLGKTTENISIEDLAAVDEFHIGGRQATSSLIAKLMFSEQHHVLDVGCGLGGAARYVADKYKNNVTGIDLSKEYIETGEALCGWLNLDKQVNLVQGSAMSMPFEDETFDGGYMLHVGMNIEDKAKLFEEIYRVLRPRTFFGIYDVMRQTDDGLIYPVPWATDSSTCKIAVSQQYKETLSDAGFGVSKENNCRDYALDFFKKLREKMATSSEPPPLGLHTLMQESTGVKINNLIENLEKGYIAPVEIIAYRY
ncbi:MAG: class I SAM-dependent methyltransferase [Alcanivoracaceae bacterium]|nr:class I SAM-dependent methyltransferase [Alcanivoracaceae bacterium]